MAAARWRFGRGRAASLARRRFGDLGRRDATARRLWPTDSVRRRSLRQSRAARGLGAAPPRPESPRRASGPVLGGRKRSPGWTWTPAAPAPRRASAALAIGALTPAQP